MEAKHPYPAYRYVMLAVIMLATVAIEIQWLTHAAVVRPAEVFYQGQFSAESFLNMVPLVVVVLTGQRSPRSQGVNTRWSDPGGIPSVSLLMKA